MSANLQPSQESEKQRFEDGLRLLKESGSLHTWSSEAILLLLSAAILVVSFPSIMSRLAPSGEQVAHSVACGLLGLTWVVVAFGAYQLRRRFAVIRKCLLEQMNATSKASVKAERLYGLSILDPLTSLYNRRFGETRLEEEIERAEESGDPLAVLAMDFDKFKHINDKYGHDAGDMALKEFARRLKRAVRACDVPIRVGGDEFLVFLPDCPPNKVKTILSRMDAIAFTVKGQRIPLSFSYGMAHYQVNDTPETLIKRADERLYASKAARKTDTPSEQSSATKPVPPTVDSNVPVGAPQAARIHRERIRRSARIPRELAVFLIGHDLNGRGFLEQTNTVDLSQHGAWVLSQHKLAPEQEIIIRRQDINKEAEARIVRVIGFQSDSYAYGVAFVSPDVDIWDIEYPRLTESEEKAIQSLFECSRCGGRETLGDGDKSEGCPADNVVRSCARCGSETMWNRVVNHERPHEGSVEAALACP